MKQSSISSFIKAINQKTNVVLLFSLLILLPFIGMSQPGAPGGGGGNPDDPSIPPVGVPFDWKLNLLLLLAGIIFSVVVFKKMNKKTVVN